LIDHYEPVILTAQDYYPFGMISRVALPNNGQTYRFGFNGKENDNGVKGLGNQQDYGMRIYDPRVGKFLSVDPIKDNFPWNSTYAYAENGPIMSKDLDGLERINYQKTIVDGKPHLTYTNTSDFYEWTWKPHMGGTKLGFTIWQLVKNPRTEYVVHQQREGTVEKFDKVQFVTYDETWTYKNFNDMVQDRNSSSGHEHAKFYLAKGGQNMKEENSANGGAGMFVNLSKGKGILEADAMTEGMSRPITEPLASLAEAESSSAVHVTLGKDIGTRLADFADRIGGVYFRNWKEKLGISNLLSFEEQFKEVTQQAVRSGGRIHFELADVSITGARRIGAKSFYDAIKIQRGTEWELNKILSSDVLKSHTDFYLNGVKQTTEQLQKMGIQ
jgi:RHS repeat-associated protein